MSDLQIPFKIRDEVRIAVFAGVPWPGILDWAGPRIVAAELRRLAALDGPFAFDHAASVELRARADELDGGAS